MLKKTVSYVDYNGEPTTEDLYFNLTSSELMDIETEFEGGFSATAMAAYEKKDSNVMWKIFKTLLHKSYGQKSPDGKRFIKNDELLSEFVQSIAYNVILNEFVSDINKAEEFMAGIMPPIPEDRKKEYEARVRAMTAQVQPAVSQTQYVPQTVQMDSASFSGQYRSQNYLDQMMK